MDGTTIQGYRLSHQQRRLWLTGGAAPAFHSYVLVRLDGQVDADRLEQALQRVVDRHEILRTRFVQQPGISVPLQVVVETGNAVLRRLARTDAGEERACEGLRAEAATGFALDEEPLLRAILLPLVGERSLLLLALPTLCTDGRSLNNLFTELVRAYDAEPGGQAGEVVQYVQFSEWQYELLGEEEAAAGRKYWHEQLAAAPAPLVLPYALKVSGGAEPPRVCRLVFARNTAERIQEGARGQGVSLGEFLLAAWAVVLGRFADRPELTVDVMVDGRRFDELQDTLGLLARPLPVRCGVSTDLAFCSVLGRIREELAEAVKWTELSPARPEEEGSNAPGSIGFELEERPAPSSAGGLTFSLVEQRVQGERMGLALRAIVTEGILTAELLYDPAVYRGEDVQRLGDSLVALAADAAARPQEPVANLLLLSPGERRRLLELDVTRSAVGDDLVHQLFERHARLAPASLAVVCRNEQVTYGELNRRANRVAHHLRRLGVGPDDRIALLVERSVEIVVGLLAILKAGAACVPLDGSQPRERLSAMVEDSGARLLLIQERWHPALSTAGLRVVSLDRPESFAGEAETDLPPLGDPANLAYVIFTSGSTGRPKGVAVEHLQLRNYVHAILDRLALPPGASWATVSSFAADLGHTSIFGALCCGGCLHVLTEEQSLDPAEIADHFDRHQVDCLKIVPSHLQALLRTAQQERLLPRQVLVLGGEASGREWARELQAMSRCRVVNHYGPTETTVGVLTYEPGAVGDDLPGATLPIGRSLANSRPYILSATGEPVPVWVMGELYIGGDGVARGYLGRPDLTAERFVPDPHAAFPGGRMYRTGDLARRRSDDTVEFLGRGDHQVKVRGFRVELGEIEAALECHPGVDRAVVMARQDQPGELQLAAYVVPRRAAGFEIDGHRRYRLPNGMAVVHQNRNETDYLFQEIFERRTYAVHGIRLPEEAVVVDIGANIGMFTLFVGRHRPRARVYSFEPVAPLFTSLRLNAELYVPNARVFPFGLSDHERTETFTFYPHHTMMSGQASYADPELEAEVVRRTLANTERQGSTEVREILPDLEQILEAHFAGEAVECRLRRLSDVFREEGIERVHLLKLDAQRAELDVLRGLDETDWEKVDQIVMELHEQEGTATAGRVAEIVRLLDVHGFSALVEQDPLLVGTDRYALYARRRDREAPGEEIGDAPPLCPASVEVTAGALREWLGERLPEPMRPGSYVLLERLPLTRNGKVDRQALPAPDSAGSPWRRSYVAPRTATEDTVAEIWKQVLGLDQVSVEASFFELGGHSLLATRIISRLRENCGTNLPVRAIFETPTVAGLAHRIDTGTVAAAARPHITSTLRSFEDELADLEALGDEDARSLLEREAGKSPGGLTG